MEKYQNVIIDAAGNAIPSVTVTVYAAGTTTPSSLFSDNGSTAKANPYVTDAVGTLVFYAANGRYDIKLTKTGYTFGTELYDTCLFDSADFTPANIDESAMNNLRLVKSSTNLTLQRVGGSLINISGTLRTMTTAPTIPPAGLAANTIYYLYAYWTGTDVGLATSVTGYTKSATTGRAEMTGNGLYRLVGMAKTSAAIAWVDTVAQRFVLSYDNRQLLQAETSFADARGTASASLTALTASENLYFLSWAGAVPIAFNSSILSDVAVSTPNTAICVDGTQVASAVAGTIPSSGYYLPVGLTAIANLAEGYHYTQIWGSTDGGGTAAWSNGSTLQAVLYG